MEIGLPSLLSRLPRPLQLNGEVKFSPVWGVHNGLKRKRNEFCACVDGDSVNVYEARAGKIVSSHAVPPSSTFTAPPCSIRRKGKSGTVRQTYCAVRSDSLRIQSYRTKESEAPEYFTDASFKLENQKSPVVHLDICYVDDAELVVVIQEDGTVTRLSAELKSPCSTKLEPVMGTNPPKFMAAAVAQASEGRSTFLQTRSDVGRDLEDGDLVLATVHFRSIGAGNDSKPEKELFYSVWALTQRQPAFPSSAQLLFQHQITLGNDSGPHSEPQSITFGPRSLSLQIRTLQAFHRYDLSGIVPRKLPSVTTGLSGHQDMLTISPTCLMVAFAGSLRIMDMNYEVVQANLDLNRTILKHKRNKPGANSAGGPLQFVAYFSQLHKCIARRRNQLVAIEVSVQSDVSGGQQPGRMSSLVQNIGRGLTTHENSFRVEQQSNTLNIGSAKTLRDLLRSWPSLRKDLDQLLQEKDIRRFENVFLETVASYSDLEKQATTEDSNSRSHSTIPTTQVHYILSKLFSVIEPSDEGHTTSLTQIRLDVPAQRIITYLSRRGYLTSWHLTGALRSLAGATASFTVSPEAVVQSLHEADATLSLLYQFLQHNASPDVNDRTAIIKFLISEALSQTNEAAQQEFRDEGELDGIMLDPSATEHVPQSTSSPSSLSPAISKCLVLGLERFGALARSTVSLQLRTSFSRREVLGLIQFLRQQLFLGGHTGSERSSKYPSPPSSDTEGVGHAKLEGQLLQKPGKTLSFDPIVKILSGCLDAIGPLSSFGSDKDDDFIESIIPDLLSEVTKASQNVEESAHLQGILRETLRFAGSKQQQSDLRSEAVGFQTDAAANLVPKTIIQLYSETAGEQEGGGVGNGLPLSLRVEGDIDAVKVRKGGGQISKRSVRETMMLDSKQKGPYSFERLVL